MDEVKKGVVLCHGKKHQPIDDYFLTLAEWYYADIQEKNDPDVVVDFLSNEAREKLLSLLPAGELYDYVLVYNCPVGGKLFSNRPKYVMWLARSLLKAGGNFIFYNFFAFAIDYYVLNELITKRYMADDVGDLQTLTLFEKYGKMAEIADQSRSILMKLGRT